MRAAQSPSVQAHRASRLDPCHVFVMFKLNSRILYSGLITGWRVDFQLCLHSRMWSRAVPIREFTREFTCTFTDWARAWSQSVNGPVNSRVHSRFGAHAGPFRECTREFTCPFTEWPRLEATA